MIWYQTKEVFLYQLSLVDYNYIAWKLWCENNGRILNNIHIIREIMAINTALVDIKSLGLFAYICFNSHNLK